MAMMNTANSGVLPVCSTILGPGSQPLSWTAI